DQGQAGRLDPAGRLRDPHRCGADQHPLHHHGARARGRRTGHRGAPGAQHRGPVPAGVGHRHPGRAGL
ncbi:MAG: Carbamoyl-phosphate synthase large chain, partial [uncultured Nocardioidaceae bacterium]